MRRRKRKRWWKKEEVRGGERWAAGSFSARRSPSLPPSASCPFLSLDKSKNPMLLSPPSLSNVTAHSLQRSGTEADGNTINPVLLFCLSNSL